MPANSNRLVLKVELYGHTKVKLTLVYLDKRFLSIDGGFKYFHKPNITSTEDSFYFYSRDKFLILKNSLRFPDLKNYQRGVVAERIFPSGQERYDFLKELHKALNKWNNDFNDFKQSIDHPTRREKIHFNGEFWIL